MRAFIAYFQINLHGSEQSHFAREIANRKTETADPICGIHVTVQIHAVLWKTVVDIKHIQGADKMDLKYWKQFENSGKIEDYLMFAAYSTQARAIDTETEQVKKEGHAGTYNSDGNRAEDISGGRVR